MKNRRITTETFFYKKSELSSQEEKKTPVIKFHHDKINPLHIFHNQTPYPDELLAKIEHERIVSKDATKIKFNDYVPSVLLTQHCAYALYNKFKKSLLPPKTQGYLGYGATAKVKLAFDIVEKKWYAVKIINKKSIRFCVSWISRCFKSTVQHEIKILKTLGLLQNFVERGTKQYIIQTLSPGTSLKIFINTIDPSNPNISHNLTRIVLSIVIQLFQAVKNLHAKKILHTDLHPSNILYDIQSNTLNIIDYGEALLTENGESWRSYSCGVKGFLAPEIDKYGCFYFKYSEASDWYAIGKIMSLCILSSNLVKRYLDSNILFCLNEIANNLVLNNPKERMYHIDDAILKLQEINKHIISEELAHTCAPSCR